MNKKSNYMERGYNKYLSNDLFPSKTLLNYYIDNEIDITEYQLVECAINADCNCGLDLKRKIFEEIMANTSDKKLAACIKNEIALVNFYERKIAEHDENHIVMLYRYDNVDYEAVFLGIYRSYQVAERIGVSSGCSFRIERFWVKDLNEDEIQGIITDVKNDEFCETKEITVYYNARGQLTDACYHIHEDSEYRKLVDSNMNLSEYLEEEIYENYPCPFNQGDFIKIVSTGGVDADVGIVYVDDNWIKDLLSKGIIPDNELYVEFPDRYGEFSHSHIKATNLEKADINEAPERLRDLLRSASGLIKGRVGIDEFQYFKSQL